MSRAPKGSRFVDMALDYARRVGDGEQPACRYVRIACETFLAGLRARRRGRGPVGVRCRAGARCDGVRCGACPTSRGRRRQADRADALADVAVHGAVRLYRDAAPTRGATGRPWCSFPKGNGKTTIAAPLSIYMTFVDGEGGAEGYAAATTRDQARILFEAAQNMLRQAPRVARELGVADCRRMRSRPRATASRFMPISSDAKTLDGLNVAVAVCDEIASHKTAEVYDALRTAMGKRRHPLLLSISTATGNTGGIGKQLWDYSVRVLEGAQEDDRLFALLYTIDEGDDPWAEDDMDQGQSRLGRVGGARRGPRHHASRRGTTLRRKPPARTRHLNMWLGADEALFSMRAWNACADRDL